MKQEIIKSFSKRLNYLLNRCDANVDLIQNDVLNRLKINLYDMTITFLDGEPKKENEVEIINLISNSISNIDGLDGIGIFLSNGNEIYLSFLISNCEPESFKDDLMIKTCDYCPHGGLIWFDPEVLDLVDFVKYLKEISFNETIIVTSDGIVIADVKSEKFIKDYEEYFEIFNS
jgi:hypothetical protein